jgi:hypothetical protein
MNRAGRGDAVGRHQAAGGLPSRPAAGAAGVLIGGGGFGTWQALIPEENGETVIVRCTLRELLGKLDEIYPAAAGGGPSGQET